MAQGIRRAAAGSGAAPGRRRSRRVTLGLLAGAAASLPLAAACGASGGGPGAAATGQPAVARRYDGTVLQHWGSYSAADRDALLQYYDRFVQEQAPGLKVEIQTVANAEYLPKLTAAIVAGTPPDSCRFKENLNHDMAARKNALALDGYLTKDRNVKLTDFTPQAVESLAYQGKPYGIPYYHQYVILGWNKELFRQAGLNPDRPPETWPELRDHARRLRLADKEQWGFKLYEFGPPPREQIFNWYMEWVWRNGGALFGRGPGGAGAAGLLPLASLALAACGAAGAPADGPAQPARREVTLEWLAGVNATEEEIYRRNLAAFEAAHAPVKISFINGTSTPGGWQVKLETMAAAGTPPDSVWHGPEWFPGIVAKGIYRPIEAAWSKEPRADVADFSPRTLEQFQWEGKQYGIPAGSTVMVLMYNKDLFDREGLAPPDQSWTFEGKFLDAARRLTRREGDRAVQFGVGNPHREWIWPYAGDAEYLDKTGTSVVLPGFPDAARWFQFAGDLRTRHRVAPSADELAAMQGGTRQFFQTGQIAMEIEGIWTLSERKLLKNFTWDVAPVPMGNKARPTPFFTDADMVCAGTRHPDEAYLLCRHIGTPDSQRLLAAETGRIPTRKSLWAYYTGLDTGLPPKNRKAIVDALEYARTAPPFRYFRDFTTQILAPLITALNQGTMSGQELVTQMTPQLEALVKRT